MNWSYISCTFPITNIFWKHYPTANTHSCQDANLVVTGGTAGCRYDNLQLALWQLRFFSALVMLVWIIPSFRIWGYVLHVEHILCFTTNCGQHQWVIPSPLSIVTGRKHYQEITIPIFWLVLQNFAIPGYFPDILFYCYRFSLFSSGRFAIAVCGLISSRLIHYRGMSKCCHRDAF